MSNKKEISRNFSRRAGSYDQYAKLQNKLADKLFKKIKDFHPTRVLDIGCGTGRLTRKIAARFKACEVVGLDLAPGMIAKARQGRQFKNLSFVVGDGEKLDFPPKYFDLVVASTSLQWMSPKKVFKQVRKVLKPGGYFVFYTFGTGTLKEIGSLGFRVNKLPSDASLKKEAKKYFTQAELRENKVLLKYDSIRAVLNSLKKTGANTLNSNNGKRIEKVKVKQLRRILNRKGPFTVSYEVIFGLLRG